MLEIAVRKLKRADPVLARTIRRVGPCRLDQEQGRGPYFETLVEAIIYQQLSIKAAAAIFGRFKRLYPGERFPRPESIVRTPDVRLRKIGLSRQKLSYVKDLARKVRTDSVRLRKMESLPDQEVIDTLTRVKGIGRWTAEMFLIFRLGRPDVLPVGDYGFRKAVQKAYGLRRLPEVGKLERLAESWRPYRSVATWYLWKSLER